MEVMKAASELRDLLIAHDRTVKIIKAVDAYINQKRRKLLYFDLDLCHSNTALQISTATGVKHMYEHYRITRIQKVQKLSQFIIANLAPNQATDSQPTIEMQVPVTMDTVASQVTKISSLRCRCD